LSVAGTNSNGNLTFINLGGGVTNSVALTAVNNLTMTSGGTGSVVIGQNIGSASTNSIVLSTVGSGSITGTKVITTSAAAGLLSASSTGGSIGPLTFSAVTVDVNAPFGAITLTDTNKTGLVTIGGAAGAATIKTAATKTFSFTGSAGIKTIANITAGTSLVIKTSNATAGVGIALNGSLDAAGVKGVVTVTAPGSGGITDTALSDISAVQTVTLSATKGAISVGSIGQATQPTTVKVTALNNITTLGAVSATTTITEKATSTTLSTITADGNIETTSATANTGVVTLTDSGPGGVIATGTDIGGGKSVTLSATKGSIAVGSIGGLLKVPATVSLTALNTITNNGLVKATTTITEKATGAAAAIDVNGNIFVTGATTGVVSLTDSGTGGITVNLAATDISGGKSVTLSATKGTTTVGSIGTALQSGIVKVTSLNALTERLGGSIVGGTSVALSTTATAASNNGAIMVDNISTGKSGVGGAISVIASGGALTVDGGAQILSKSSTNKALITLENKNASTTATPGSILINGGANIITTNITTGGTNGNVNIVIGAVPGAPTGTVLPPNGGATGLNFNIAQPAKPVFFFGTPNGVTLTSNNLSLIDINSIAGGKVIFNTGKVAAANITVLGGGAIPATATVITADPPAGSAPSAPAAVAQARAELLNTLGLTQAPGQGNVSSLQQVPSSGSTVAKNSNLYLNNSGGSLVNTGAPSGSSVPTITGSAGSISSTGSSSGEWLGALQSSIVDSNTSPATRTLYGAASQYDVPAESIYIGRDQAQVGEIEATLVGASADIGIDGADAKSIEMAGWTGVDAKVMKLRKGNVVVAPKVDTVVETAFGKVAVGARSMALIMALPTGTAVFNLDDTRKNAVVITIGKTQVTLAPGRHVMVTSHLVEGFEMVNSAESFGYRNVATQKCDGDLQAFTSEFSMTNAIANVKQLRALVNSRHPEAQRLAAHMIKTAAIVSEISGAGQYQQYQHPRMTATALVR
jgi:hypothetical protein